MMTAWWKKLTGAALVVGMVAGSGVPALAAPAEATPEAATAESELFEEAPVVQEPPVVDESQVDQKAPDQLRRLIQEIRETHGQIVAQREELRGQLHTIRELLQALKEDESIDRVALEKAKVELRELRILDGDRKAVNARIEEAHQELKDAIRDRNWAGAIRSGTHLISLMHTKLDILRSANRTAGQAIAHLQAAQAGQGAQH
jgi:TolA-binding protein